MRYWLFKTEPDVFSIDDLKAVGREPWNGIRNYQARNLLRDEVKAGDGVLIYHSSCKRVGVAGTATVVKAGYIDPDQFDPDDKYHDPKATVDKPRWYRVDVAFEQRFDDIVPLATLKSTTALANMVLLKQGRLSVQPVTAAQWRCILKLAGV